MKINVRNLPLEQALAMPAPAPKKLKKPWWLFRTLVRILSVPDLVATKFKYEKIGMKKAGKRLANEIIDVYEEGIDEPTTDAVFEHEKLMMQLPLRRVTLADEELAKREIRAYLATKSGDIDYNDVANMHVYTGLLQRLELQDKIDIVDTEVHIMRLGNIAFATNPFELFLDYGNQIRVRSLAEQTFLVQLANGHEGYLPTEKAEKGGHYSAYVSSGTVGHVGGEQLVRETLTVIKKMFTK